MAETLAFADLRKGMRARLQTVESDDHDTARLMDLGLTPGVEFSVVKVAPLGDPIEIEFRGSRVCLRRQEGKAMRLVRIDG